MARHPKYVKYQRQKGKWLDKIYADLGDDAPKIMKHFSTIRSIYGAAKQVSKLKPVKLDGKKIKVEEQIQNITPLLEKLITTATAQDFRTLAETIQSNSNFKQVEGTIDWIMKRYNVYDAKSVLKIYEDIVSAREDDDPDFYEHFMSTISNAALSGKSVVRSAATSLRNRDKVELF